MSERETSGKTFARIRHVAGVGHAIALLIGLSLAANAQASSPARGLDSRDTLLRTPSLIVVRIRPARDNVTGLAMVRPDGRLLAELRAAPGHVDGDLATARTFPVGSVALDRAGHVVFTAGPTIRMIDSNRVVTLVEGQRLLKPPVAFFWNLFHGVQGHLTELTIRDDGTFRVYNTARKHWYSVAPGREPVVQPVDGSDL